MMMMLTRVMTVSGEKGANCLWAEWVSMVEASSSSYQGLCWAQSKLVCSSCIHSCLVAWPTPLPYSPCSKLSRSRIHRVEGVCARRADNSPSLDRSSLRNERTWITRER